MRGTIDIMENNKLNLFKTRNGSYFVSLDKELSKSSLIKVRSVFSGFRKARTLESFLWTPRFSDLVKFLGSFESLEAAEAAILAREAELEAAFN